jgi:hypothetical protein
MVAVPGARVARRGTACLIYPLATFEAPGEQWSTGPLELPYQRGRETILTTTETRQTYFQDRVVSALYERRWHRPADERLLSCSVWGLEIVVAPDHVTPAVALAVVHLSLGADGVRDLESLTRSTAAEDTTAAIAALLPDGCTVDPAVRRAWSVAHATFAGDVPPLDTASDMSARDQWLWVMASSTTLSSYPQSADAFGMLQGVRELSGDWDMLALRDGLGFLGRTRDDGGQNFHATAATLVHTVYLDLFLLSRMQLLVLNGLANALAVPGTSHLDRTPLRILQFRMAMFRKTLWWQSVGVYGRANDMLGVIQHEAQLPELLSQVVSDLKDVTEYAESVASRRTNALLALLTVVGLPYGVTFAGVITWASPSPALFGIAIGIATALASALTVAIPSARELIRELFDQGDPS